MKSEAEQTISILSYALFANAVYLECEQYIFIIVVISSYWFNSLVC